MFQKWLNNHLWGLQKMVRKREVSSSSLNENVLLMSELKRRMTRLLRADRKAVAAKITTRYSKHKTKVGVTSVG